ncbi:hypothetical protein SAMN05443574_13612 [Haloarcula vallismortis]|uniref:Transposase IS4-like domain-containing protein n=2 Tax=Haloarcula vallismortis TaxID=28442 RepID=M0JMP6_HALVA|nr:hypothetical protein [Haloarcula vallismortis]EMA09608.1 hypothetical protein C437_05445 [Haloarcula vallismortis ATCC 29715]SDX36172.1 hypothetical protein SAMN05443574_13612 [Haloarcula vallismortis]
MAVSDLPDASELVTQAATLFDIHDDLSRVIRDLSIPTEELCATHDISNDWDSAFDADPMIRLFLYKEIRGDSQKQVAERFKQWPYLRQRFEFDHSPTQQAISYTKRKRFPLGLRQFISTVAEGIRDEAQAHDDFRARNVRMDLPEPDPDEVQASDQPLHHYVDQHAPDLMSTLLNDVAPAFDTGRAANAKHSDRAIWEQQTLMSLMDRAGTRASYRTFNKFQNDAVYHDTHVRAVKKLGTPTGYQFTFDDFAASNWQGDPIPEWRRIADTIQTQFSDAVERMLNSVRVSDIFTEPVVAAIDVTGIPFHVTPWKGEDDIEPDDERIVVDGETGETRTPKDEYPTMVNGAKEDGVFEYQYATLTIAGPNTPLVVAVEPIRHHSDWEGDDGRSVSWAEVVDRLMEQANELVDIHLVMADKAFDQHGVFHVLDQRHDVAYLIPKKEDSKHLRAQAADVREDDAVTARVEQGAPLHLRDDTPYIDVEDDPDVAEDNYSHDLTFMHVPANRDDWIIRHADDTGYAIFATNRDEVTPLDAEGLVNRYSERWDIEIEYKMIQPLMPSIASTDYRMRFFAFVFSCLLHNMWRVVDHSLKKLASGQFDDYGRGPHEDRLETILPLADFLASSIVLIFQDTWDPPDEPT